MNELGDTEFISHYEQQNEKSRLLDGAGALEYARSQELIERHLSSPPAVILDVGGGPGAYAYWLAEKGYEVHLIDPVPKHIHQAREAAQGQCDHPLASVRRGDARSLSHVDGSIDSVLLLGPLYHLMERKERIEALSEAFRVLRPGGYVFAAGINRFASLLSGTIKGYVHDPYFREIVERDLSTGRHLNPRNHPAYFTTAFLHRPEELEGEVSEVGFTVRAMLAVEGPAWLAKDFESCWSDTEKRTELLDLVRKVEGEPELLSVCPHFMVIGEKEEQQKRR